MIQKTNRDKLLPKAKKKGYITNVKFPKFSQ